MLYICVSHLRLESSYGRKAAGAPFGHVPVARGALDLVREWELATSVPDQRPASGLTTNKRAPSQFFCPRMYACCMYLWRCVLVVGALLNVGWLSWVPPPRQVRAWQVFRLPPLERAVADFVREVCEPASSRSKKAVPAEATLKRLTELIEHLQYVVTEGCFDELREMVFYVCAQER